VFSQNVNNVFSGINDATNVTTNMYLIPTDNGTPTHYTGMAGTVYLGKPCFLTIRPPEGP
jgi:hypothetical protein